ncbi:glycosyltransferase family 4 protein [Polynucleobacter paneuropaeus]|nr:glycosyltransferase family 4 protein [Polynucleobacter paneuropaeus]
MAVFLWDHEKNRDWVLDNKPWIKVLGGGGKSPTWEDLKHILMEFEPDHVLVGGYKLPFSLRVKLYSFLHGIKFYYWLEKPLPCTGMRKFFRSIAWLATLPFSEITFCIGMDAVNAYKPFARNSINLPYSIDAGRYIKRDKNNSNHPLKCIYIGQYINRKGVPEILEAFSLIKNNEATLTMVGSGELNVLVEQIALKCKNINNRGFIDPNVLPKVMSEHDILLAPSHHDGWGVVVVEAMLTGLPVVSTKETGAFLELGNPDGSQKNGTLCEVSAQSIRAAVMSYVDHPESVNIEGEAARGTALKSLAVTKNAAEKLINYLS